MKDLKEILREMEKKAGAAAGPARTAAEALAKMDALKLCFPFEVATKFGPALLAKATISPELAAELLPFEADFRKKQYTLKRGDDGRWTLCQWYRLIYLEAPAPTPKQVIEIETR